MSDLISELFPLDGRTVEKISKVILNTLFIHVFSYVFVPLLFSVVQLRNSWQLHDSENSVTQWNGSLSIQFTCYTLLLMKEHGINHENQFFWCNVSNQNISMINTIRISSNFSLSRLSFFFLCWKFLFSSKMSFRTLSYLLAHFCQNMHVKYV